MFQGRSAVRRVCLLVTLLAAACPRPLIPELGGGSTSGAPPTVVALLPLGQPCERGAQCESAACVDGTCCEGTCRAGLACNLPRSPGVCTARVAGDACSDATDCGTGFCEQGVCCTTSCDGTCMSCSHGAQPGVCGLIPDNEDPHNDCGALCAACFGGLCLPAHPGTDPGADCAGNAQGNVCTTQGDCGRPEGAACAQDAECAVGRCLAGSCVVA